MHSFARGETLFLEGEADDRYFVVLEGEVELVAGGELQRVLAPGDGFGEIAVLHGVPRTTRRSRARRPGSWRWLERSCAAGSAATCPSSAAAERRADLPGGPAVCFNTSFSCPR